MARARTGDGASQGHAPGVEMPRTVRPMLAELARRPFDSPRYWFEPKWDGLRAIAFVAGREPCWLQSRRGVRWRWQFPEVTQALDTIGVHHRCVLDGELVASGELGRPDFTAILERSLVRSPLRASEAARRRPATYMVFDLLYLDGEDLRGRPFDERRRRLERWAEQAMAGTSALLLSPAVVGKGRTLFEQAERLDLEGVMAKLRTSPYLEGRRSPYWLKIKRWAEEVMCVAGFVPDGREGMRSIAVAAERDDGRWQLAGLVGSGLSPARQRHLRRALEPLRLPAPDPDLVVPMMPSPVAPWRRRDPWPKVSWVAPRLQVRVRYLDRTEHGWLRHASLVDVEPGGEPQGERS
ncbi:hypothetical protein U7230_08190 [Carboxydochorda subterranea]|uniref:DNA ligase (ATP) n=1 Tax=Carboxydichorda subterranea TaxID=3109565 RepID=A0ABZ1BTV7_9FIRM|nr:hypothetical protein [Limnochorda sp. L945t]WRP16086.1 hypothetical protein U7230_08190 [Limnochorda sp. L945t]